MPSNVVVLWVVTSYCDDCGQEPAVWFSEEAAKRDHDEQVALHADHVCGNVDVGRHEVSVQVNQLRAWLAQPTVRQAIEEDRDAD